MTVSPPLYLPLSSHRTDATYQSRPFVPPGMISQPAVDHFERKSTHQKQGTPSIFFGRLTEEQKNTLRNSVLKEAIDDWVSKQHHFPDQEDHIKIGPIMAPLLDSLHLAIFNAIKQKTSNKNSLAAKAFAGNYEPVSQVMAYPSTTFNESSNLNSYTGVILVALDQASLGQFQKAVSRKIAGEPVSSNEIPKHCFLIIPAYQRAINTSDTGSSW